MDSHPLPRRLQVTITQPVVADPFGRGCLAGPLEQLSHRSAERQAMAQVAAQQGVRPTGAYVLDCLPQELQDRALGQRRLVVEVHLD